MSKDNGFGAWGGYMDAKIIKLDEQFEDASHPFRVSDLFKGISIFVNGRTNPSSDKLKRLMMTYGGVFHHYEKNTTTFIVAENLPDVKVRRLQSEKKKVIKPQWVVDCIKEDRILDYTNYLLYTNQKTTQPSVNFFQQNNTNNNNNNNNNTPNTDNNTKNNNNNNTPNTDNNTNNNNNTPNTDNNTKNNNKNNTPNTDNNTKNNNNKNTPKNNNNTPKNNNNTPNTDNNTKNNNNNNTPKNNNNATNNNNNNVAVKSNNLEMKEKNKSKRRTANDPNFIKDYYDNSRLHHISTLSTALKKYISDIRKCDNFDPLNGLLNVKSKLEKHKIPEDQQDTTWLKKNMEFIMHIDMDCFFVSVGLLRHPSLRGQPVVVTHSRGGAAAANVPVHADADRQLEKKMWMESNGQKVTSGKINDTFNTSSSSLSEIASCNYEARQYGITNGMFMGTALKLCPHLKAIPYDFEAYKRVSYQLYDIVAEYTCDIEPTSIDEMYVSLTTLVKHLEVDPMRIVSLIREQVYTITGCTCSAGVGSNKLLARLATYRAKPNGQFHVRDNDVVSFMQDMPIVKLPGYSAHKLTEMKIDPDMTCGNFVEDPVYQRLKNNGGKNYEKLYQLCKGIDPRPLQYIFERKYISVDINYGMRFDNWDEVKDFLDRLLTELHSRLLESELKTKCVSLKVMKRKENAPRETAKYLGHGICDTLTKNKKLLEFSNNKKELLEVVISLMLEMEVKPEDIRGIGVQFTKLSDQIVKKDKKQPYITSFLGKNANKNGTTLIIKKKPKEEEDDNFSLDLTEQNEKPKDSELYTGPSTSKGLGKPMSKLAEFLADDEIIDENKEFLMSLPPELRNEIMGIDEQVATSNDFEMYTGPSTSKGQGKPKNTLPDFMAEESMLDERSDFLMSLPQHLRDEITQNFEQLERMEAQFAVSKAFEDRVISEPDPVPQLCDLLFEDEQNLFDRCDFYQVIINWMKAQEVPNDINVCMIIDNAIEMVSAGRHEEIYGKLSWLQEVMAKKDDCKWHIAATTILEHVADEMCEFTTDKIPFFLMNPVNCDKCSSKELKN